MGVCYDNGLGVEKDSQKAFNWYQEAAKNGKMEAQYNLGFFYDRGELVNQNFKKAVLNSTKEINSDYHPDVRIQLELFCNDGISRMICLGDDKILIYDCKKLDYNDILIEPILKLISEHSKINE